MDKLKIIEQVLFSNIYRCTQMKGYSVIFAYSNEDSLEKYKDVIENFHCKDKGGINRICIYKTKIENIEFNNGSIIRFVNGNTHARGYRCNHLVIDQKLSNKAYEETLLPYLIPYRNCDLIMECFPMEFLDM